MEPLTIEKQILRQKEKGCISGGEVIRNFLSTSSYYTINYSYEEYLKHDGNIKPFKIQDYKWLQETNERISKETLSVILRTERIIRNRIADQYSLYCRDNEIEYFTEESFNVDSKDFTKDDMTDEAKDKLKQDFIEECWYIYKKKKRHLNPKYHFHSIQNVPPFVIAQHLSFGQLRTFFKLLRKNLKEDIVKEFNLKIQEFNQIIEKLNYLRNACAHGEFIMNFTTQRIKRISDHKYHKIIYNDKFILNNKISLIPVLSLSVYILRTDNKFFKSSMRNICEMARYGNKGVINAHTLQTNLGLTVDPKIVQKCFT